MNRILSLFLCLGFFFLFSCEENHNFIGPENGESFPVTMTVRKETVSPGGLILEFKNGSAQPYIYGEAFLLEKDNRGEWTAVPVVVEGDYGFDDIAYGLDPEENKTWEVRWDWLYGDLTPGTYRISKDIVSSQAPGEYERYCLAAEFTIDDQNISFALDLIGGEYRADWRENYEYDTPLLIGDFTEWINFRKGHPSSFGDKEISPQINEELFAQHVLYAYVKSEGSGSVSLRVKKAERQGEKLFLHMERIVPEVGTCDMATRVCLFGLPKAQLEGIKSVAAVISSCPKKGGF